MELSARNQLAGTVASISLGGIMAEVAVDIGGGNTVVAAVTRASVEANLREERGVLRDAMGPARRIPRFLIACLIAAAVAGGVVSLDGTAARQASPEASPAASDTFTGVRLYALIEAAGITAEPDARNPLLPRYVVVSANDGYRVVFSGGELDPNFGNAPILVAWEQDGQPLAGEDGPVRIVAPGDLRGGRYVFGVVSIELLEIGA